MVKPVLWKIYRERIADSKLKKEFPEKMNEISCSRERIVTRQN
jgi:hypothetical protein